MLMILHSEDWFCRLAICCTCPYALHLESNTWSPRQIHPLPGPPRQTSYTITNGSTSARGTLYCLARVDGRVSKRWITIKICLVN